MDLAFRAGEGGGPASPLGSMELGLGWGILVPRLGHRLTQGEGGIRAPESCKGQQGLCLLSPAGTQPSLGTRRLTKAESRRQVSTGSAAHAVSPAPSTRSAGSAGSAPS